MDASKQFIHNHNRSVTRAHGFKPVDVFNDDDLRWPAYRVQKANARRHNRETAKYKTNDTVRLSVLKPEFAKEMDKTYSGEIYTVKAVDTNKRKPMYTLMDERSDLLKGKAYEYVLYILFIRTDTRNIRMFVIAKNCKRLNRRVRTLRISLTKFLNDGSKMENGRVLCGGKDTVEVLTDGSRIVTSWMLRRIGAQLDNATFWRM